MLTPAGAACKDWILAEQRDCNDAVIFNESFSSWLLAREEYQPFWDTLCTNETAAFVRRHMDSEISHCGALSAFR